MHGLDKEPVSTREEARAIIEEWIGGWRTDGLGPFIIETASTNREVVGQAGLMIFDTRGWTPSTWANAGTRGQPELGWALMRAHWVADMRPKRLRQSGNGHMSVYPSTGLSP
jgi:RimJ/RimL family protein N-acetyltransferase